jgi:hypothetical protein
VSYSGRAICVVLALVHRPTLTPSLSVLVLRISSLPASGIVPSPLSSVICAFPPPTHPPTHTHTHTHTQALVGSRY